MGERSAPLLLQKRKVGLQNLMFRECYFQTREKSQEIVTTSNNRLMKNSISQSHVV